MSGALGLRLAPLTREWSASPTPSSSSEHQQLAGQTQIRIDQLRSRVAQLENRFHQDQIAHKEQVAILETENARLLRANNDLCAHTSRVSPDQVPQGQQGQQGGHAVEPADNTTPPSPQHGRHRLQDLSTQEEAHERLHQAFVKVAGMAELFAEGVRAQAIEKTNGLEEDGIAGHSLQEWSDCFAAALLPWSAPA